MCWNWFSGLPLTEIEDFPCAILRVIQVKANVMVTNRTFLKPSLDSDASLWLDFNMVSVFQVFLFLKNILEKRFILKMTLACRYIAFKFRGFRRTTPRVHSYRFFGTVQSSFSVERNRRRDRWCLLRQPENSAGTLCVERPIYFPFFSFSSRHMLSAMGLLAAVSQSAAEDVQFLSRVQYNAAFDRLPLARAVHTKTHVDEGRQKPIVIEFDRSSVDGQFHFASDPFLSHCCSWFLRTRLFLH